MIKTYPAFTPQPRLILSKRFFADKEHIRIPNTQLYMLLPIRMVEKIPGRVTPPRQR